MRSRPVNIVGRAAVAVAAACTVACGVAACGGGTDAAALVRDTFNAHEPIESGRVDLDMSLSGVGGGALRKPIALQLSGPFQGAGTGKVPEFSLTFALASSGQTMRAGATSAGGGLYIALEGTYFKAPASAVEALRRSYRKAAAKGSEGENFEGLGVDPGKWLANPVDKGEVKLHGEETVHIEGGLNASALLKDTDKLEGATGSLGGATGSLEGATGSLGGATGSLGLGGATSGGLSPKLARQLAKSVKVAHVEVYTGASDHLLRLLVVHASLVPTPETRTALGGVRRAKLSLRLGFSQLGKQQTIAPPAEAKPLSQLLEVLGQLGLVGNSDTKAGA